MLTEKQYIQATEWLTLAQRGKFPITRQHIDSLSKILAEQPRAAEQGHGENMQNTTIGGPVVCHDCGQPYNCARDIHICKPPAQQPAGDLIWRMQHAYLRGVKDSDHELCKADGCCEYGMTAALAVAREGYVRLDDVDKAIRSTYHGPALDALDINDFIMEVRNRLAKP